MLGIELYSSYTNNKKTEILYVLITNFMCNFQQVPLVTMKLEPNGNGSYILTLSLGFFLQLH